jgi:hypothetical protein
MQRKDLLASFQSPIDSRHLSLPLAIEICWVPIEMYLRVRKANTLKVRRQGSIQLHSMQKQMSVNRKFMFVDKNQ